MVLRARVTMLEFMLRKCAEGQVGGSPNAAEINAGIDARADIFEVIHYTHC